MIRLRNNQGSALVELAICLPVFIMILFAIIQFGQTYYRYMIVTQASREGARSAAVGESNTDIETKAKKVLQNNKLNETTTVVCDPANQSDRTRGKQVTVTVDYPINISIPFVPSIFQNKISCSTTMLIE